MRKRLITGAVYVAVLLAFYIARLLLKEFVFCPLIFDALLLLFTVIGTFEMCRALGNKIDALERGVVGIFSTGLVLGYALSDVLFRYAGGENYAPLVAFAVFMTGVSVLCALPVFRHERTSLESVGCSLLALVYPSAFLLIVSGINHLSAYSEIGILFVFAICPFADCFAYLFGILLKKKFPKKLAPTVSPNKTVIGGIGGLLGGTIGAVCIFFVYYGIIRPADIAEKLPGLVFFIALGVLASAFAELGDLVESAFKRKLNVKDMGKLLPGHGGILDRIDSVLYAAPIVCLVLVIKLMTTG